MVTEDEEFIHFAVEQDMGILEIVNKSTRSIQALETEYSVVHLQCTLQLVYLPVPQAHFEP